MTIRELKERVDLIISRLKDNEDLDVVIPNNTPSMGPIGATSVKGVQSGFDWNKGRLFIYPEKEMTNL